MKKKDFFSLMTTVLFSVFLIALINGCNLAGDGGFGDDTDTSTTTSTTTTTILYSHNLIFETSGGTFYGSDISTVYACGEFNSWNTTANPMNYNADSNYYEIEVDMPSGTSEYKFRVLYNSGEELWYADKKSVGYTDDGWHGFNSTLTLPFVTPDYYNVSGTFSNVTETIISYWISSSIGQQYLDLWEPETHSDFSFQVSAKDNSYFYIGTTNSFTNSTLSTFRYACYYTGAINSDIVIPYINFAFNTSSMSPNFGDVEFISNITFSWDSPSSITDLSNISLLILKPETDGYYLKFITNIEPTETSFNYTGSDDITAAGEYFWLLAMEGTNSTEYATTLRKINLTN